MRARSSTFARSCAALAIMTASASAGAQPTPDQRAAAAALFEDGKKLMAAGKLDQACPKLAESQNLDPGMGTLFNLALCHEKAGRTASAWVGFREVAALAKAAGQGEREKVAHEKEAALEPKLIRLKITVSAGAGVEVKRDGLVIGSAIWGTAVPVDPGKHVVSASAPGKETWETTITADQPGKTLTLEVPPLAEKKGPAATPPPSPIAPATPPAQPAPDAAPPRPWQRPLGITSLAVGAVGLGVGTAFGFMAKSAFDGSNTSGACDAKTNRCSDAGLDQRADAVKKGNIGTGLFIAGAVLAAGGIVLWATAPSAKAATSGSFHHTEIALGAGDVTVRGSF
jgi:hypothetical protein